MNQLRIIGRALSHRDAVALRSGSEQHTYVDLLTRSESVAAVLLDACDDLNEARIAYLLPAGFDHIAVQWGIWRAGGIAVPLSLSATEKELQYTLSDSQADCIVTTRQLAVKVSPLCDRLKLRTLIADGLDDTPRATLPEIDPSRRAMILYTSGTTSKPKGVVTTHACIQSQIESLIETWRWQADDRIPLFLPLHHIHGIIKSGGYKLSALEIEAALLDHPAIVACAVVGIPDDTWGELVAVAVVLQDAGRLALDGLRSWCRDRLSPYKIPRRLIVVDQLPRNAMGKVTKPSVLKLFHGTWE